MKDISFITDRDIYTEMILREVPDTKEFLWLATSHIKDLYISKNGKMAPFLELLSDLALNGVSIRLIHAREPGPTFRKDFDRYPVLIDGMERLMCPRAHVKYIVIDGRIAFAGSANLTGAGVGAKSGNRRNFESGFITRDKKIVGQIMDHFDGIWMGSHCRDCGRREYCSDHVDMMGD